MDSKIHGNNFFTSLKGGHLIAGFRKGSLTESKQVTRPSDLEFYYIK